MNKELKNKIKEVLANKLKVENNENETMTPEQKAKELVDKFLGQCASDNGDQALVLSKNCAIIAVYEILNVLFQHHEIDFWKQVKEEINKL